MKIRILFLLILVNFIKSILGIGLSKNVDNLSELSRYDDVVEKALRLYKDPKYLKVVKLANQTVDSKSVVDRSTKRPFDDVINALDAVDENSVDEARRFVQDYLEEPGLDVLNTNLTDWNPSPSFVNKIKSDMLKEFALSINKLWLDLYKEFNSTKYDGTFISSHLPMKHPFIVPGGRFREMYYWDTYWTMEGLLVCGMHRTVRQMLENFILFINQYGFIPNGSRVYYLNRSQPPYFAQMLMSYYEHAIRSKDIDKKERKEMKKFVLNEGLNALLKEYDFWMNNRTVDIEKDGKTYTLNQYRANDNYPRVESYEEDIETASHVTNETEKERIYLDLTSAAESGYDFTTRWLKEPTKLETIQTTNIVPIDLNALLYKVETIIAKLCAQKGDYLTHLKFEFKANKRKTAINKLMWSPTHYFWSDYNIATKSLNDNFYITNLFPLAADIKPPDAKVNDIIERHQGKLIKFEGGIPVSLINSTQQWDFPNAWPPNQHTIIKILHNYDRNLAIQVARIYFSSVYNGLKKHNAVFEKYNALKSGERGYGGEYEVQTGFGWTNGAVLSIIDTYKDALINDIIVRI